MKLPIITVLVVALLALLQSAAYIVPEWEQVLITQFGEAVGEPINEPGLKFKIPFVQRVNRFDKRWLDWDGTPDELITKEKTFIFVDTYARWRIIDSLKFLKTVKNEPTARSRISAIIGSITRNVIASYDLIEVLRLSNREFRKISGIDSVKLSPDVAEKFPKIETGREKITTQILDKAASALLDYGIEVVDIQFQRVNYTDSVKQEAFGRMIQDRKSIAAAYRSEGAGEAARIRGDKERELKSITSGAYETAETLKGQADAKATDIYAAAHNRDPGFYRFIKSLDSYGETLDQDSMLLLSADSEYLKPLIHAGK